MVLCDSDYNEMISNRLLVEDEERKYGEIPIRLYLKLCGQRFVAIFCVTTFCWQAMRVFTDFWLKLWTDIDNEHRFDDVSVSNTQPR